MKRQEMLEKYRAEELKAISDGRLRGSVFGYFKMKKASKKKIKEIARIVLGIENLEE